MDIMIGFSVLFLLLIGSAFKGLFVGYSLIVGIAIFIYIGKRHGYTLPSLFKMCFKGGKKSLVVLKIFFLIGGIIALWMAAGTIPAIVYYGMKLIHPRLFILSAFLVTCAVSLLIGTAFGSIGTIGIALIIMAKSGGVSLPLVAGAIMSGAYLGDRNSPMSSSANLVAQITQTNLYSNIKNMFSTSLYPILITIIIYAILSGYYPITKSSTLISQGIEHSFNVSLWVILPALSIIILSFFRVDVKLSMFISLTIALIISTWLQSYTIIENIKFALLGFQMEKSSPISDVLQGGGILSMMKLGLIVFLSSAYTGIFEGTDLLKKLIYRFDRKRTRTALFKQTILISIATSIIGCTQALAVMLSNILIHDTYEKNGLSKDQIAIDLENSAIVIAPLIPWNIAALVPLSTMGAGPTAILYSFYLYLLPSIYWISLGLKSRSAMKKDINFPI